MDRTVTVSLGDTVQISVGDEGLLLTLEEARELAWQLLGFKSLRNGALTVLTDGAAAGIAAKLHALAREFEP